MRCKPKSARPSASAAVHCAINRRGRSMHAQWEKARHLPEGYNNQGKGKDSVGHCAVQGRVRAGLFRAARWQGVSSAFGGHKVAQVARSGRARVVEHVGGSAVASSARHAARRDLRQRVEGGAGTHTSQPAGLLPAAAGGGAHAAQPRTMPPPPPPPPPPHAPGPGCHRWRPSARRAA